VPGPEVRDRYPEPSSSSAINFAELLFPHGTTTAGPPGIGSLAAPTGTPLRVTIPGYELLGELGRGGMGVVYKARQLKLDRVVALKVIVAGPLAGADDQARFRNEAEAVARLHHPNIVCIYDVGEHGGYAYIAFEYVGGGTLAAWLRGGTPAPTDAAARLVATLARAVQFAHDQGIVHRDLKPANILLVSSGVVSGESSEPASTHHSPLTTHQPKIADFGLAKRMRGGSDLTATGMVCGTPNYIAPEQIRGGKAALGPAVDVYGLGCILFEVLTSRPPFVGPSPGEVLEAVLGDDAPAVRQLRPDVPPDLETVVARCLAKDPAKRYPSAAAVAEDLDLFLSGRTIAAKTTGPIERGRRWVRRHWTAAALIAVLAVGFAVAAAVSVVLWRSAEAERSAREQVDLARKEALAERDRAEHELAAALMEYAHLLANDGRADEAARLYRRATDILERVVTDAPRVMNYHADLARAYRHLAGLALADGRPAEALDLCDRGLKRIAVLCHAAPGVSAYESIREELTRLRSDAEATSRSRPSGSTK
jgi:hypothetical protein